MTAVWYSAAPLFARRGALRCPADTRSGGLAGGIRTGYRIGWNDILWDSSYRMIAYSQKIIYLQAVTVVCIRTEAAQEAILRPASY